MRIVEYNHIYISAIIAFRSKLEKKHGHTERPDKGGIAGELGHEAARKQLHESLIPLQWLARKNGFKRTARLLEEAINTITEK